MKARLVDSIPRDPGWVYEVKLDGVRAIAVKDGTEVELFSRRPRELTQHHPNIAEAIRGLSAQKLVLDGEIVALDEHGRTSFQVLQNLKRAQGERSHVFYTVFDILHLNGKDLLALPLAERQDLLGKLLRRVRGPLRQSVCFSSAPAKLWREVTRLGLEGVIAKRANSSYEADQRTGAWQKIKLQKEQEFVIGGYTPPRGGRKYFGSLLVGYYDDERLICASKVGTGFNHTTLKSLFSLFQKHRVDSCPFSNLPAPRSRFGQGITRAAMKTCTWLRPKLIGQVRFLEWTSDGSLRQPVFLGLRDDKNPRDVVRER